MINVSTEKNAAQRAHQKAGAEGHEGQHQLREFAASREEDSTNGARVVAEDEEVVHFQEIATRHAYHRPDLLPSLRACECWHDFLLGQASRRPLLSLHHERALLLRRAGIHISSSVEVIVDLRGGANHAAIEEDIERRGLQVLFRQCTRAEILP
jgi:hypothetical protein